MIWGGLDVSAGPKHHAVQHMHRLKSYFRRRVDSAYNITNISGLEGGLWFASLDPSWLGDEGSQELAQIVI